MLGLALILSSDGLSILRRVSACWFRLVLWLEVTINHNSCPRAEELSAVGWRVWGLGRQSCCLKHS